MPFDQLRWLDRTKRADHPFLTDADHCFYFGEYQAHEGWQACAVNQLITNYKRTPAEIAASPQASALQRYKLKAIDEIADTLTRTIHRGLVETQLTFVPLAPSKVPSHAHYCERLEQTLRRAFQQIPGADIRPLLRQTQSTPADHRSVRQRFAELLPITELNRAHLSPPVRDCLVLFDDVLTTGKHFKVATLRIREALPHQHIIGLFVARTVRIASGADTAFAHPRQTA